MAQRGSSSGDKRRSIDADGVVRIGPGDGEGRGRGKAALAALAVLAVAGAVGAWIWLGAEPGAEAPGSAATVSGKVSGKAPASGRLRLVQRELAKGQPADADEPAAPGAQSAERADGVGQASGPAESADRRDAAERARERGAAARALGFPPPGSERIKEGIVVPEDFELPPGYVRHYQTTDKGQRLDAILMFHPRFELVDEGGNVVPMPEDRVVPPELAPPGLEVELLDVPDDAYGDDDAEAAGP